MSPTIAARARELVEEFKGLPDWEARYKRLIEIGRESPELPEEFKTEDNKVRGCQSQVWMRAWLDDQRQVRFEADSDALLVKGLVNLLMRVYSGSAPADILNFPPEFLKDLGFESNLSPSRANGLHSMLKQIRNYSIAFHYQIQQQK